MKCANCKIHKGTEQWVGNEGILAWTHGMYAMWCKCCCLKAQIKHAEDEIMHLIRMKMKLEKLKCK